MKYHTTKRGTKIKLSDLEVSHLKNIMRWMELKAKSGLTIRSGGGHDSEDMYYDEETYYGEDALRELNYYDYKKELNHRNENTRTRL